MTLGEAQKVAAIASCADGGCPHCVHELCAMLQEQFPEFELVSGFPRAVITVTEKEKSK